MFPTLAVSLPLLLASLLFPSSAASQTLWENPVDFGGTNFWPPESCVRSCLTGDQCVPCNGYSLSTWVGCTNNACFCSNFEMAYFYLFDCIMINCCLNCVSTNPYNLIYGYCASTGEKVSAAAGEGGGGATVATTFTAPPSVTPTEKPSSNPYAAEGSDTPPTPTTPATAPQASDTGLTRSDKIALGVGLGVGIPSVIAAVIVVIQFCRGG